MRLAPDDVEARSPFLTEMLAWKREHVDHLQRLPLRNTPEQVEEHWHYLSQDILQLIRKHFAAKEASPRKEWATEEIPACVL